MAGPAEKLKTRMSSILALFTPDTEFVRNLDPVSQDSMRMRRVPARTTMSGDSSWSFDQAVTTSTGTRAVTASVNLTETRCEPMVLIGLAGWIERLSIDGPPAFLIACAN